MWTIFVYQLIAAAVASVIVGGVVSWAAAIALVYGALVGLMVSLLTQRSADKTLAAAVTDATRGMLALYSGFALRYGAAILGLAIGFKVLELSAQLIIAGFVLMILVQALGAILPALRSDE